MLRIYGETVPLEDVVRARTIALLQRHDLELVLAVRPWQSAELPGVVRVLRDAGIGCSVWPMLTDDEGRWASAHNAASFTRFLRSTVDSLDAAGVLPREVLLDLEPPFAHARAMAAGGGSSARWFDLASARPRQLAAPVLDAASAELASAVRSLHARSYRAEQARGLGASFGFVG